MKTAPLFIDGIAPSSPSATDSTSGSSPTQQNTKSAPSAATAGVVASEPPCWAVHASAFARVRLKTVTS